jgi:phosphoribosylamine--glycine ligase
MKVLVVGSGAREHAIVWKLALSPNVDSIYCVPGNGGTALIAQNVEMGISTEAECDQVAGWAFNSQIDLVIIGPEVPLSHGMADTLMMFGIKVAGPTKAAAQIEWSKSWARDFMKRHGIPSPDYSVVQGKNEILEVLRDPQTSYPLVMKADGLAAGKGAEVLRDAEHGAEILNKMQQMLALPAEDSAIKVVLEEYLEGVEVSALAFSDGRDVSMMPPSCDYKRLLDGDDGPFTGGMGSYSPTRFVTPELWEHVEEQIMRKTVRAMLEEGIPFRGFLYAGLMLTSGGPKVLEFNSRLGDPEAQVLLARLVTPLEEICTAISSGGLSQISPIEWSDEPAVGVVIASEGYPSANAVPQTVGGLADLEEGVLIFHGGTELKGAATINPLDASMPEQPSVFNAIFSRRERKTTNNLRTDLLSPRIIATGGRLVTIVAHAPTIGEAREIAYRNVTRIDIEGMHYRQDIALREVEVPVGSE